MRSALLAGISVTVAFAAVEPRAQTPASEPSPVQLANQRKRQRVMDLLGVRSIAPGAVSSGPATYDESTANPYPRPPDPLRLNDGQPVTNATIPKGSFLAAVGAGPVNRLLGGTDLGMSKFPALDTPLDSGDLGFHQHPGGYTPGADLAGVPAVRGALPPADHPVTSVAPAAPRLRPVGGGRLHPSVLSEW